jgi:hypothetical protein
MRGSGQRDGLNIKTGKRRRRLHYLMGHDHPMIGEVALNTES